MVVSLGVVTAIHFARRSKPPFQRAQGLSKLLYARSAVYTGVSLISIMSLKPKVY